MSNFSPMDWSRAIVNKQYRPLNTVFNFQNRKSMNPACLIYIKLLIQICLLSLHQGIPQWWYRSLKLFLVLNLQTNMSPLTKSGSPFRLALRIRRIYFSNETFKLRRNELIQAQYTLTDVDTTSVSSTRRYNVFIRSHTPTHITQPFATFSHPPNLVLLNCLNINLFQ